MKKERVLVAMSGGVDSSVAALLLKEKYDVLGVSFILREPAEASRPSGEESVQIAGKTARRLGIPHHVSDLRKQFNEEVIDYFCEEYALGQTPNPCVRCNRLVKFDRLFKEAGRLEADYVATGHYARVEYDAPEGRFVLKKGADPARDQSYFLYSLPAGWLERILMPLGRYSKPAVRKLAAEAGLPAAYEPGSREICFLRGGDYRDFIRSRMPRAVKPGEILDKKGALLGLHDGIINYTRGQRKRLGIKSARPHYVVSVEGNSIIAGGKQDLYSDACLLDEVNFLLGEFAGPERAEVKIRHPGGFSPATVLPGEEKGRLQINFDRPVWAAAPGQSAVFYKGEIAAGGGIIAREG